MSRILKAVAASGVGLLLFALPVGLQRVHAQTPAQMEYERQAREARQAEERRQQEQQRQQQLMNENARRQQEEQNRSIRSNLPSGSSPSVPSGGVPSTGSGPASSPSGARVVQDSRQTWEKRPVLPPDRNPLLGRWAKQAADQSTLLGAMQSLVTAGACGLFFGAENGFVEFRPATLVAVSRNGREQVLAEVAYRGGDKRVALLPKVTPQALIDLFVFDINGPDRATLVNSDCTMVRVGAVTASTASARGVPTSAPGSAAQAGTAGSLVAGLAAPGGAFQPLVGGSFFVLKESAEAILMKTGFKTSPGVSPLKAWTVACGNEQPACKQGMLEIIKNSIAVIRTDGAGRAQLAGLPSGTYYLFGLNQLNQQAVLWHVRTDVRPGAGPITLDQRNGMLLN